MGQVIINEETTKNPITMIGKYAGECWGADTSDDAKNFKRGLECLESGHMRTSEFPDVYMILDGYSARVIREWYTHIGGMPTRLQASTRYINYENFDYVIPHTVLQNSVTTEIYKKTMQQIAAAATALESLGVPREDAAMLFPLGMSTKVACKHNCRNLIDMSHQRMCSRAYWEFRELFYDLIKALKEYSEEWAIIINKFFKPKCEVCGFCVEKKSCGRKEKKVE
jgi:thymidylate synthase (FAD)